MRRLMKILFVSAVISLLHSCSDASHAERMTAGEIIQANDEGKDESKLLAASMEVIGKYDQGKICNKLTLHLQFIPKTTNKDSLLKAAAIYTDRVQLGMENDPDCADKEKSCLVFFYLSEKKFKDRQWEMRGKVKGLNPATADPGIFE